MIKSPGNYTVTLLYDKGAHAIEIESVALYEGDREIARDAHPGKSGTRKENIQYILNVPEVKSGAAYTVRAKLKAPEAMTPTAQFTLRRPEIPLSFRNKSLRN